MCGECYSSKIIFQSKIVKGGCVETFMRRCVDFLGPRSPDQVEGRFAGMTKKSAFLVIFFFTIVWKSVNITVCLPAGKRKPPVGEDDISVCMS